MNDQLELSQIDREHNNNNNNKMKEEENSDEKEKAKRPKFRYLWKNFASNTTAHGFSQLLLSSNLYVKCFWIAAIIACQVLLYLQIYPLVVRYLQKPTKTQILLQEEVFQTFPMTTICNANAIKRSQLEHLKQDSRFKGSQDLLVESRPKPKRKRRFAPTAGPQPTGYHTPEPSDFETDETSFIQQEIESKIFSRLATIAQMDGAKVYQYGFQLDEIMNKCRWQTIYNCEGSKWWAPFWHWKYGNCYTFNMDRQITNATNETNLHKVMSAGPDIGLELTLRINQAEYFNNPMSDTGAIILHVAEQGERIEPFANGFSLAPSFAHFIGLHKIKITRADPFNNQSCMAHTKIDLGPRSFSYRYINKYSVRACRDICLAEELLTQCDCTIYSLPSLNGNRTCDTNDTSCTDYYWQQAVENNLDCLKNCRLPCHETTYKMETSFRKYPIRKKPGKVGSPDDEKLKVSIYFKTMETQIIKNEEYYFLENLLGDIGGQLGLFSGVSALTVVEVMFLLGNVFFIFGLYLLYFIGCARNQIKSFK